MEVEHHQINMNNMQQQEINAANIKAQMRKGMLEYCVLLMLSRRRCYPSDIISLLQKASMIVVEGTLYTLLNRMKREGKLKYEWEESPKGPPRKYYSITEFGQSVLRLMTEAWQETSNTVTQLQNENTNEKDL